MGTADKAPPRWDIVGDSLLQECRVWDLRSRRYRHPVSGNEGDFFYIDSRDWAVVVARTVEGALVMVRQFRWGSDELSWELPGGIIDAARTRSRRAFASCVRKLATWPSGPIDR